MNTRIEQLTRTYLNSLYNTYLNENQKREIIRLNDETNWIIFNNRSLRNKYSGGADKTYDITSEPLQKIFQEQLKIHRSPDWKDNFLSGDDDPNSISLDNIRVKFLNVLRSRSLSTWIAVDKTALGNGFGAVTMDIDNVDLTVGTTQIKSNESLNVLLNDPAITSSMAPSSSNNDGERQGQGRAETPPSPPNTHQQDNGTHNNQPATQTIQFKIKSVSEYEFSSFFDIEPDSPITVNGRQVTLIETFGRKIKDYYQNGDLQVGNTISVTNIRFSEYDGAKINDYNELSIGSRDYDEIQVVSSSTPPPTSPPPETPTFFSEVRQKNQELNKEENNMVLLAEELLKVIRDNNEVCQEAQKLRLNLPVFSANVLDYFQEIFFTQLDENQPLNSSHNSQINTDNENIRKKKLNIKKNIYGIYNKNKKKLTEKKNGQTSLPKNKLEKLKEEVKEKINKVLTDKDNLRNINLIVLANGKYQNWEKDIEGFNGQDEVTVYVEDFLTALKEMGAKERGEEIVIVPKSSPQNTSIITNSAKKIISSSSLPAAKSIAKNKIRELFKQNKPDLEKLKEVWEGEESWVSYLEKCNSPEKVLAFLEKLEKAIISQRIQGQTNNKIKKPAPANSWILPFLVISLTVLVSMAIIIKIRRKGKKIK